MTPRRGGDEGQAAVELALVLPLLFLLLLALVQVGLVVRDQVLLVHAAREAVRQAAVEAGSDGPRRAAITGSGLAADRLAVQVTGRGGAGSRVAVRLSYKEPTDVPLIGGLVGDLTLSAAATMRVEQ